MKKQYDWFKTLQQGRGKDISRCLFFTFTTETAITKSFYPSAYEKQKKKKNEYVDKNVHRFCKGWQDLGFLEKSKPIHINITNRWGGKQKRVVYYKIMNLEPIFKYCKDYRNIEFSNDEKSFLKMLLLNEKIRIAIIEEYPDEDLINATLKFYVKNCVNRYSSLIRDLHENPKKYEKQKERAKQINKQIKRLNFSISDFDVIKVLVYEKTQDLSTLDFLFREYFSDVSLRREIVESTDNKILKALNLLPSVN